MLIAALAALVLTGSAQAFTCPATPLSERIAQAEVVFVGHSTGYKPGGRRRRPQRLYRFNVDQKVKGDDRSRSSSCASPSRPRTGGR